MAKFILLLLSLSALPVAAQYSCTVASSPLTMRLEGTAELSGEIVITCGGTHSSNGITGDLIVAFNTPVSNDFGGGQNVFGAPPRLLINEPATLQVGNTIAATQINAQQIRFSSVPFAPTGVTTTQNRILRITYTRLNANFLPNNAQVFALLASPVIALGSGVTVGFVQTGAFISGTAPALYQCFATNQQTNQPATNPGQLRINEGFANAFRKRQDVTPAVGVFDGTEKGFRYSSATQGTRVLARFSNVPAGARLYVASSITSGLLLAQLTSADANGDGSFQTIPGSSLFGGLYNEVSISGGAGYAVWEVLAADPAGNDQLFIPYVVSYAAGAASAGTATVSTTLSPISGSFLFPSEPRFADSGTSRTAFTIGSTCPTLIPTPSNLTFSGLAGGAAPASQNLAINTNPSGFSFTATPTSTGNWLNVSTGSATSPANLTVSPSTSGLAAGTYVGNVAIRWAGADVNVPVTLILTAVSVGVSPPTATLQPNQTQQFNATVTGTANQAVNWSITPAIGSISASGLYTAPATVAATQTVTIRATSQASGTASGTATVTVNPLVTVSVSPSLATLQAGQTRQFGATVTGSQSVIWSISPSIGSISPTGLYTAPSSITAQQTIVVTATSQASPSASGTAAVTLAPFIFVTVSPSTSTLQPSQTLQLTAAVSGTANQAVTWSLSPALGSITPNGLYTAPSSISPQQTIDISATSQAHPSAVDTAKVTLAPPTSCAFQLSSPGASFDSGGGSTTVSVATAAGCNWSAVSPDSWAQVVSGGTGTGPGSVNISTSANSSGARSTILVIGGQNFVISQSGAGCSAALQAPSAKFGASSAQSTVELTTNCAWTAASNVPWVSISGATTGTGNATITFAVAQNSLATGRAGSLTIAGLIFAVRQSAASCDYLSLVPRNRTFTAAGGAGSLLVSTREGCPYSISSSAGFVNVGGGRTGNGTATAEFTVAANPTALTRKAVVSASGQSFTITQFGTAAAAVSCAVTRARPADVRSTGRAERLADLEVNCSGRTGARPIIADVLVTLNATNTSRLTGPTANVIEATLLTSAGISVNGRAQGANLIRFNGVRLSSGEETLAASFRISGIRADVAPLGTPPNLHPVEIVASLSIRTPAEVPLSDATQVVANSRGAAVIQRGAPRNGPSSNQRVLPVTIQEGFASSFRTLDGEAAGFTSTTPTRLRLRFGRVPAGAQLYLPVAPVGGGLQLVSAGNDGTGGAPVSGSARAGSTYSQVSVSGGSAAAFWEIVSINTLAIDSYELPLLFENITAEELANVTIDFALAPVNDVSRPSASAPIPRFLDPSVPPALANLRLATTVRAANSRPTVQRFPVDIGRSVTFQHLIINDSDRALNNISLQGTLPQGMTGVTCTAPSGACSVLGNDVQYTQSNMAPGAQSSVEVSAAVGGVSGCPNCSHGQELPVTASVAAEQPEPNVPDNVTDSEIEAQEPACNFSLSRSLLTASSAGRTEVVDVTTGPACDWTVQNPGNGITLSPLGAVRGGATITVTVPANSQANARQLVAGLAGNTLTIVQAAAGCTFNFTGLPSSLPGSGGEADVSLQTGGACTWQAVALPEWLTVEPSQGTGARTLRLRYAPNSAGIQRNGFIEAGGQQLLVRQLPTSGCIVDVSPASASFSAAGGSGSASISATGCPWFVSSSVSWITINSPANGSGNAQLSYTVAANSGTPRTGTILVSGVMFTVTQAGAGAFSTNGLRFVPMTPCRVLETRPEYNFEGRTGAFGPPYLRSGETRSIRPADSSVCSIPATAKAYVFNVTVVPRGPLDFATLWPGGTARPEYWTVRSPDGNTVANSAIVAATSGAIQVYASNDVDMILDISGYFTDYAPAGTNLVFYPLNPCRVIDTRVEYRPVSGPFGPPSMGERETRRFRFPVGPCTIPTNAVAYSVTITAVPNGPLQFLTAWPSGGNQPNVSNINSPAARVLANNVIIPAGTDGAIDVFTFNQTNFLIDISGYFAPDDGSNGQYYFPVTPCRANDSRATGIYTDEEVRRIAVPTAPGCAGIPVSAKAYAVNFTALPNGAPMPFLTAYPSDQSRPNASILNAFEGQVVTNSAIIPAGSDGGISVYAFRRTNVVVEISGYFGR